MAAATHSRLGFCVDTFASGPSPRESFSFFFVLKVADHGPLTWPARATDLLDNVK